MTELICRYAGIAAFLVFAAYGLTGTLNLIRTAPVPPGPRPWALFTLFTLVEAVQVYGLIVPRPGTDARGGAVVALTALCFCAYLQRLYFVSVAKGQTTFPRAPFYIGIAILLAVVFAAHAASPYLP
jgi:hypothetical protein